MAPLLVFSVSEELLHGYAQSLQDRDPQHVKLVLYSQQRPLDLVKLDTHIRLDSHRPGTDAEMLLLANGSSYLWFDEEHGPRTLELRAALRDRGCRLNFVVCPTAREYAQSIGDPAMIVSGRAANENARLWGDFSHTARRPALPAGMEVIDVRGSNEAFDMANEVKATDRSPTGSYKNGLTVFNHSFFRTLPVIAILVTCFRLQVEVGGLTAEIQQLKVAQGVLVDRLQASEVAQGVLVAKLEASEVAQGVLVARLDASEAFRKQMDIEHWHWTNVTKKQEDHLENITTDLREMNANLTAFFVRQDEWEVAMRCLISGLMGNFREWLRLHNATLAQQKVAKRWW